MFFRLAAFEAFYFLAWSPPPPSNPTVVSLLTEMLVTGFPPPPDKKKKRIVPEEVLILSLGQMFCHSYVDEISGVFIFDRSFA